MPSRNTDPALLPAHVMSDEIGAGRLSPIDLVEAALKRIEAADGKLHAFVEVYDKEARLAAEAADKAIRSGHRIGPLHGIPIALKDLIEIEGRITTGGSQVWRERRSAYTATLAQKLIAELIRRDLPFYDATISAGFVAGMNQFARDIGILQGDIPYDRVVAARFAPLWHD